MYHIAKLLNANELAACRALLQKGTWEDGASTAGKQAGTVKNNLQLADNSPEATELNKIISAALAKNALFFSIALPSKIFPLSYNRYVADTNQYGNHVDNPLRTHATSSSYYRTDLSFTVFLSEPNEYEGGELVLPTSLEEKAIKLAAGDMIVYPSNTVHRVQPVTSGERLACFSWVQSMVTNIEQRELLLTMSLNLAKIRKQHGDSAELLNLTNSYNNLLRMWAQV